MTLNKLRWKRFRKSDGFFHPGDSVLHDGEHEYARVQQIAEGKWYWTSVRETVKAYKSTWSTPTTEEQAAKDQAMRFVTNRLRYLEQFKID